MNFFNTKLISLSLVSAGGFLIFAVQNRLAGYALLLIALLLSLLVSKRMAQDVAALVSGILIVSIVPINTEISWSHMSIMAAALAGAIILPYCLSKYYYKQHSIEFPFGFREPWGKSKWTYLLLVGLVGFLILPFYMINSGVYQNWPATNELSSITRLFIGTNALGIWDELFFICTAFTIFRKYVSFWSANILQAVIFTSFLYELGFESYGPILIFIFALTQGYIFKITHSLYYLLCVHLLFDFILFWVLIHAHNPGVLSIFFY